jgi:predicted amidohydrolase
MRIACWQAASAGPADAPETMLTRLAATVERAGEARADLLVTPELFATGYPIRMPREHLGEVGRSFVSRVEDIAARTGISIVFGWPEAAGDTLYNAVSLVTPVGGTQATYRKIHLYGEYEQATFTPGDVPVVQAAVSGVTVGLAICYDVEFPELVREHALAGTDLLVVPTALTRPWEFVAETLVPARAFESQLFIAYTNWSGGDSRLAYCGLSRVVDPHGRVHMADPEDAEDLLVTDIRLGELAKARAITPYLRDRRPACYAT